jgi:translocator protein
MIVIYQRGIYLIKFRILTSGEFPVRIELMPRFLKYLASVLICLGVGFAGSYFTISEIPTWYASLNKPFFSPPNWVFGPVWTTLYIMMGISIALVVEKAPKIKRNDFLGIFAFQLILNFLWSVVFFGIHQPLPAFIIIIALWINILVLILLFRKYSLAASLLLVPYLLWVSFASFLNLAVVYLN